MLLGTYHNIRVSCNLGIIASAIDFATDIDSQNGIFLVVGRSFFGQACSYIIIVSITDVVAFASQTSTCGNRYRHIDVVSYERT